MTALFSCPHHPRKGPTPYTITLGVRTPAHELEAHTHSVPCRNPIASARWASGVDQLQNFRHEHGDSSTTLDRRLSTPVPDGRASPRSSPAPLFTLPPVQSILQGASPRPAPCLFPSAPASVPHDLIYSFGHTCPSGGSSLTAAGCRSGAELRSVYERERGALGWGCFWL